ncbi:MAG TPA: hypothetical protein V6C96_05085 [Vampirovibrionales bacterium]
MLDSIIGGLAKDLLGGGNKSEGAQSGQPSIEAKDQAQVFNINIGNVEEMSQLGQSPEGFAGKAPESSSLGF